MFSAINRASFDFQTEGAYQQQICHIKHCKSLSLRIHKTNHSILTGVLLVSLNLTERRRQGIHMIYHLAVFQLKPHSDITRRKSEIKKV